MSSQIETTDRPAPIRENWDKFDDIERLIKSTCPAVECPVHHLFTPGLYSREFHAPAGSVVTSKIHKTEHQYIVSSGYAKVWIDGVGWQEIRAPYRGITMPGTRRVLIVLEDLIWTTFHPTNLVDVDEIEREIIEERHEHLDGITQPVLDEQAEKALKGE